MSLVDALEPLSCCPHIVVVIGKGGVGKTTVSILIAMELSRIGKTLLLSLDPAKHLARYLGLSGEDFKEVNNHLHVRQVSIEKEVRRLTSKYAELLQEILPSLAVLNLDNIVNAIKYTPGVEEEVLLSKISEALRSEYNYVVIDTPPTGVTLRTLALPKLYLTWLSKLIEIRERIVSLRYVIARTLGKSVDVRDKALLKLYDMREEFKLLDSVLCSDARASYILVATPEPLPMYELKETYEFLKSNLGVKPRLLVLNKVLPDNIAFELGQQEMQKDFLKELGSFGISYAVIEHLRKPTENMSDIEALKTKIKVFKQ
ncbi:MAG: TRC40/GET3/ArsA family transport-energizing ATPase [Sulfolobales archaeon]